MRNKLAWKILALVSGVVIIANGPAAGANATNATPMHSDGERIWLEVRQ